MPRLITFQIILSLSLLLVFTNQVIANESEFNISSETIFRFFEREKEDEKKFKAIPIYEYLGIDYGDPELSGFSFHANGWRRVDLGDQEYYRNDTDGYILNGYIQYSNPIEGLDVKLGRQHIYSGIVNDSVDGIGLKGYAGSHISMFAFGGYPVGYEDVNGRTGDSTCGGRATLQQFFPGEIGLSYKKLINDNDTVENKLGVDLSLYLFSSFAFSGLSVWNFETENWGEHSYSADMYINRFSLKAHYQKFQYKDYFSDKKSSQLFSYLQDSNETLTVIGGDIIWQKFHGLDAALKLNHYTYDMRRETSRYMAVVFNIYGQEQTATGVEVGIMEGESEENSYYLGRIYFYWDTPARLLENWFVDGEIMYVRYEEKIFRKDNSIFASTGCGRKIIDDTLKVKFSGDYSSDPYHDFDIRFMTVVQFEY